MSETNRENAFDDGVEAAQGDLGFQLDSIRHMALRRGWAPQEVRMIFSAGMAACSVSRPDLFLVDMKLGESGNG